MIGGRAGAEPLPSVSGPFRLLPPLPSRTLVKGSTSESSGAGYKSIVRSSHRLGPAPHATSRDLQKWSIRTIRKRVDAALDQTTRHRIRVIVDQVPSPARERMCGGGSTPLVPVSDHTAGSECSSVVGPVSRANSGVVRPAVQRPRIARRPSARVVPLRLLRRRGQRRTDPMRRRWGCPRLRPG